MEKTVSWKEVIRSRSRLIVYGSLAVASVATIFYVLQTPPTILAADQFKRFSTEASKDDPEAQYQLALIYKSGSPAVQQDLNEAVAWLQKSAGNGHHGAENELGVLYEKGEGVERNLARASELYLKAANGGNPAAQANAGRVYEEGIGGVQQDKVKAAEWYEKAADNDIPGAQHNLASMYLAGDGVRQNLEEAAHWFSKAADEHHFGPAQVSLGLMYLQGNGVKADLQRGAELLVAASRQNVEQAKAFLLQEHQLCAGDAAVADKPSHCFVDAYAGDPEAQLYLASLYSKGSFFPQDFEKAASWIKKSAFANNANAQMMMSIIYYKGEGVPKDLVESLAWRKVVEKRAVSDPLIKDFLRASAKYETLSVRQQQSAQALAEKYIALLPGEIDQK